MATPAFPGPKLDKVIDSDPQIVRVPLEYTEFGSRASALPKSLNKSETTIKHVGNGSK